MRARCAEHAAHQARQLIEPVLSGLGTIARREHADRAATIARRVFERWGVGPYRWKLKHVWWFLTCVGDNQSDADSLPLLVDRHAASRSPRAPARLVAVPARAVGAAPAREFSFRMTLIATTPAGYRSDAPPRRPARRELVQSGEAHAAVAEDLGLIPRRIRWNTLGAARPVLFY